MEDKITKVVWLEPDHTACEVHWDSGRSAAVPNDPRNRDYAEVLAWIDEGNEPAPWAAPTIVDHAKDLTEGKKLATAQVQYTAYNLLLPTDWVVTREMETGVSAPAETTAYRTAVRAAADEKVGTIEGKQKLETLTTYLRSEEFTSWPEPPTA